MEDFIGKAWSKPNPPGKVKRWEDDGQGGGYMLLLTPAEAREFDANEDRKLREWAEYQERMAKLDDEAAQREAWSHADD